MESTTAGASKPFDLTKLGPFTEEEMTAMASALLKKIDIPFKSSEPAPKRGLWELFGIQKTFKTSITFEAEKFFRRNKFKAYCPPESAEHEDVRADVGDNPIIHQIKHLNVVTDQCFSLGWTRDYHMSMVSRNLDDMLYWYEKGRRKGTFSEKHANSAKQWIYELLEQGGIDVSIFYTCSVEAAMRREYGQSVTQKRGSKMNEKDVAEALEIYEKVMSDIKINIPDLPMFHIDTSKMTVQEATQESLRYVLPTLCVKYNVPDYSFMPYALSLVQKVAKSSAHFEEQLKLYGHPINEKIYKAGWVMARESSQTDTYLNPSPDLPLNPRGEVLRIRQEGDSYKFMYKGESRDNILSHRLPHTLSLEKSEAENILLTYDLVAKLSKQRKHFTKEGSDGHFFTLHVDTVEGLGDFTEIRARGSHDKDHTKELLALAEELGFSTSSIVNGNYLSIAMLS